ncbi:hypothetical protein EVG20_g5796 [Dentipellis fragilis]|uniref:Uncharacterized protein n=1 Tax=Dentipellis fragilis TaxID=205917 RepID=A0A4Y9YQZ1_9AGAM|nr:hypothetical protein EVG20_g5796 [Dentipellis fragilis]
MVLGRGVLEEGGNVHGGRRQRRGRWKEESDGKWDRRSQERSRSPFIFAPTSLLPPVALFLFVLRRCAGVGADDELGHAGASGVRSAVRVRMVLLSVRHVLSPASLDLDLRSRQFHAHVTLPPAAPPPSSTAPSLFVDRGPASSHRQAAPDARRPTPRPARANPRIDQDTSHARRFRHARISSDGCELGSHHPKLLISRIPMSHTYPRMFSPGLSSVLRCLAVHIPWRLRGIRWSHVGRCPCWGGISPICLRASSSNESLSFKASNFLSGFDSRAVADGVQCSCVKDDGRRQGYGNGRNNYTTVGAADTLGMPVGETNEENSTDLSLGITALDVVSQMANETPQQ